VRRIAVRTAEGRQINLLAVSALPAPRLIEIMRGRWGQENAFKHGAERWGINQLDGRVTEPFAPESIVPNPARRRQQRAHVDPARRPAEEHHPRRVASEAPDVGLHPAQRGDDVHQAKAASRELLPALAGAGTLGHGCFGGWSVSVPTRVPRWFACPPRPGRGTRSARAPALGARRCLTGRVRATSDL
jgi:hypothetical protein